MGGVVGSGNSQFSFGVVGLAVSFTVDYLLWCAEREAQQGKFFQSDETLFLAIRKRHSRSQQKKNRRSILEK